jgi:hypothetical protein
MFEVREGWGWLFLLIKYTRTPLIFEVREGMGLAVVTQKRTPEPPAHI